MVIDTLAQAHKYYVLGERFVKAFKYLQETDLASLEKGKYEIDGDHVFAIINEYDSIDAANEQMEAHKKHIDVQYVVKGEELVGHDFLVDQTPSKAYDEEKDFMLFAERPSFFSKLQTGMFGIFFPTDLHMPNIKVSEPVQVKKVVIKIKVD
ncbi:MAG: YhcH/YjgK/YiaL family protein [Filimonas sp.]|nr:YhcH/YjgK/YiaL family protein [Filimonas sp.]